MMIKQFFCAAASAGLMLTAACDSKTDSVPAIPGLTVSAPALHNPNTIDSYTLAGIEVLTDETQDAILLGRPYATPSDFHAVVSKFLNAEGQGRVYEVLFVPMNANTAIEADIKLVPSALTPEKLAHEVDEYRPYADMIQFERELAKYMEPAEMAKLKRYFTVQ